MKLKLSFIEEAELNEKMTARIIGIGAYAPEQVVTNQDLTKFLDTNDHAVRSLAGGKGR